MKPTAHPIPSFRQFPALCLLACCLTLSASPAMAAERSGPEQEIPSEQALLTEIAASARDRALFAAKFASEISRIAKSCGYRNPDILVDSLWALRSSPEIQKEWLDKLAAPGLTDGKRKQAVYKFERFMEDVRDQAEKLPRRKPANHNLWTWLRRNVMETVARNYCRGPEAKTPFSQALVKFEQTKEREKDFADALVPADIYRKAGLTPRNGEPYLAHLLELKDRPEDLKFAADYIRKGEWSRPILEALLTTLVKDPVKARNDMANLEKTMALELRYLFAMEDEGVNDIILLPLASLLPDAAKSVEKTGNVPLAGTGRKNAKALAVKRLDRLLPKGVSLLNGGLPPLPFLSKGERLYAIGSGNGGVPLYSSTPLEAFTDAGPAIKEITRDNIDFLSLLGTNHQKVSSPEQRYLIAAVCGPEELATHLASVSVVFAAREKSLYGPFSDYEWRLGKPRFPLQQLKIKSDYPRDSPGQAYRLVRLDNPDFFLVLAPLTDKKGLARLMGPIRGIWTQNADDEDTSWTELRYTLGTAKWELYSLGASPVLNLGQPVLEALVASHKRSQLLYWTRFWLRETCRDNESPCEEKFSGILTEMEELFTSLQSKGFVSPFDMSTAIYILELAGASDPELRLKMEVVLDDTSLSSGKRVDALIEMYAEWVVRRL